MSSDDGVYQTLIAFGKNPRKFIIGMVLLWAVNQFVGFVETVLGLLVVGFDQLASVPVLIGETLDLAGSSVAAPLFATLDAVSGGLAGVLTTLGWTAPLVVALAFVALSEASEAVGPALARSGTDLLGVIPVVGPLLDAIFSFLIDVVGGLWGGDS